MGYAIATEIYDCVHEITEDTLGHKNIVQLSMATGPNVNSSFATSLKKTKETNFENLGKSGKSVIMQLKQTV